MENLRAKDIMNPDVLSVNIEWPIDQLSEFLIENSISGAPVISEKGSLVGVVSLTDIVRYKSFPMDNPQPANPHEYYLHAAERQYSQSEIETFRVETESLVIVRDIMTPMTFNVNEKTELSRVADAMIRGRIHRVFVTKAEKLVGIITTMDMLRVIRDLCS